MSIVGLALLLGFSPARTGEKPSAELFADAADRFIRGYRFDIFPTVAALAEIPVPDGVEGKSLRGVMDGKEARVRDALFTAYRDVQRAVRTDRWKLIRYPKIDKVQLFDLAEDPDELRDLSSDPAHAARLKEMLALLDEERRRWGDGL